jgi:hypothetical protein
LIGSQDKIPQGDITMGEFEWTPIYTMEDRKPVRGRTLSPVNWEKLLKACERVTSNVASIPDKFWTGMDTWKLNSRRKKTDFEEEFEELFEI